MFGSVRRVISGDDVCDNPQQQQQEQQGLNGQSADNINNTAAAAAAATAQQSNPPPPPAMIVEPDTTEYSTDHNAPLDLIAPPNRNTSDTFTTSSSLSDASQEDADVNNLNNKNTMMMHHQVDVYMEDVLGGVHEGSPTPLAGVGSGNVLNQHPPTHYQLQPRTTTTTNAQNTTTTTAMTTNNNHNNNHHHRGLQRMDSSDGSDSGSARNAAASQNSSRDWGWFEDVHQSGQLTPTGSLTKGHRSGGGGSSSGNGGTSRGGGGGGGGGSRKPNHKMMMKPIVPRMVVGLDPKDETAAAAMAVTAPTYVLEESLSSQRLWKDTAGNRPPQPVEERAFYEKMWAQNFARSQVNYQMPVEVLTATSPISLSPFADGGVMEISAAVAAENNGGNFQQYNLNTNTPANTHNMMIMPSTRGAISGGNPKEGGDAGPNAGQEDGGVGGGPSITGGLREAPRPAPPTVLPPTNHQHIVNKTAKTESGDNLTVLVRGDNVFGTTVSKSFACSDEKGGPVTGVDTVNISIASYRVVESHKNGKYAQFLVIYREGSIRDTIGVWKRYSDFDDLAKKVTQAHEGCASVIANMSPLAITEEHDVEHLPNAITSWRLLKKRQRWYRCLDAGYLSLKVFLLERFLHDILFESSSPKLLREFVGADESLSR